MYVYNWFILLHFLYSNKNLKKKKKQEANKSSKYPYNKTWGKRGGGNIVIYATLKKISDNLLIKQKQCILHLKLRLLSTMDIDLLSHLTKSKKQTCFK